MWANFAVKIRFNYILCCYYKIDNDHITSIDTSITNIKLSDDIKFNCFSKHFSNNVIIKYIY